MSCSKICIGGIVDRMLSRASLAEIDFCEYSCLRFSDYLVRRSSGYSMDYSRWSDCPPRAPMGRADAIYATHDHVILILGRIADFAAKDRERKIKAVEANGGQWRPTPGMPMGPPPQ